MLLNGWEVFEFPFIPPSANNRTASNRWGGQYLTAQERGFKQEVIRITRDQWRPNEMLDKALTHQAIVIESIKGKSQHTGLMLQKLDLDNGLKSLLDAVYAGIKLDDSRLVECYKIQVVHHSPFCIIAVRPTELITWDPGMLEALLQRGGSPCIK